MAQLNGLSVVLLCCLIGVICDDTIDNKFKDAAQFVLDSFNDQPGSLYVYDSAKIIHAYENVSKVFKSIVVKSKTQKDMRNLPYLLTYVRSWALPEKLPIV
jgi:hypothetical protein